jgi:hypothetical protein
MTDSRFIPCEEWVEMLTMLPDHLSPSNRTALNSHLQACPKCSEVRKDNERILSLLEALPAPEIPATLPFALEQLLLQDQEEASVINDGQEALSEYPMSLVVAEKTRRFYKQTPEISTPEVVIDLKNENLQTNRGNPQAFDIPRQKMPSKVDELSNTGRVIDFSKETDAIVALNKADLTFRLAEWHCKHAETDSEQRRYAQASLHAAMQRAFIFAWIEKQQVKLKKRNGEYISMSPTSLNDTYKS